MDLRTRAAAAVLAVGMDAALSGSTAAQLHGCTAISSPDIHMTLPYWRWVRSSAGLVIHHDRFSSDDVEILDGLPVLVFDLVIAELLCRARRPDALACADQALRMLSSSPQADFYDQVLNRLLTRDDRRGVGKALDLWAMATPKAESPPESWLRLVVVDHGFPMPTSQFEITTIDGVVVYVLDLAWPALRIALEYDGFVAHEGRQDYDAERDRYMAKRGWITVRATAEDLRDPTHLIRRMRKVFRSRDYAV